MGESERMYAVRHKSVDFDNLIIDLGSICFQWVLRFTEVYAQLLSNAINHQHSPRNSQIEKKRRWRFYARRKLFKIGYANSINSPIEKIQNKTTKWKINKNRKRSQDEWQNNSRTVKYMDRMNWNPNDCAQKPESRFKRDSSIHWFNTIHTSDL